MLDTTAPTPLQQVDNLLVKRDDLFKIAGVCGGKARTCWAMGQGAPGLVTAVNRSSPQGDVVAHVAKALGVPCRVHVPTGKLGPELVAAQARSTVAQMYNQQAGALRVVVPVGSGMSLAGILHGLAQAAFTVPVVGVVVGADPVKRLDKWAPKHWRNLCQLVQAGIDFHKPAPVVRLGDMELDPIFEAKCLPFLQPGDLFWVVGIRQGP